MAYIFENSELVVFGNGKSVRLSSIAEKSRAPFYIYDLDDILLRVEWLKAAFGQRTPVIHYALKANAHPEILKALARAGVGADVVSGGELDLALKAGMPAHKIVFSGVGKTADEITLALDRNILQINVESLPEVLRIIKIAKGRRKVAPIALRMNPHIKVETHPYIATGQKENKFGIGPEEIPAVIEVLKREKEFVALQGIAFHLGSQLFDVAPVVQAVSDAKELFLSLRSQGFPLRTFDIGGGLGVDYKNQDLKADQQLFANYGNAVGDLLKGFDGELHCEPGRALVARSGALLGQVQYVKQTAHKKFIILDTGMNHLLRPALYQAEHRIVPVVQDSKRPLATCDVAGPICESADILGAGVKLPEPLEGEWLAILDAGAYGYVMASTYNARPLPNEFVVSNHQVIS